MACVATDLTNQFGIVFWFVRVGCFLHWDGVFLLDAICFVALAGATFSFAVAGLSAIEALSFESFSFGLCCCCGSGLVVLVGGLEEVTALNG